MTQVLGDFVEGLDKDALNLSVFAGAVELKGMKLKRSAFDRLGVPVSLAAGYVKLIKLDIPWRSLGSKPIRIEVDTVFACILPRSQYETPDTTPLKRGALAAGIRGSSAAAAAAAAAVLLMIIVHAR